MNFSLGTGNIGTVFLIDSDYDSFMVWNMLRYANLKESVALAKGMGIDAAAAKGIRNCSSYGQCSKKVGMIAKKRYESESDLLGKALVSYKREWEKIDDAFYSAVEDITKITWQFSEYRVVLSLFHHGISNRGGNVIVRSAHENPGEHTRITAHEILMIQLWRIFENVFGKKAVNEREKFYWQANEITAVALLGLERRLNGLWADNQKGFDRFLLNYPDMNTLKNILKIQYENRRDFSAYLEDIRNLSSK